MWLCSFEDEQYPSNNVDSWYLITEYPNDGIGFLVSFDKVTQYSKNLDQNNSTHGIYSVAQWGYWDPFKFW
jgi:hypothetical protein